MKSPPTTPTLESVRLSPTVTAIIAALPPAIAERIRRDTERMLRDAHAERRRSWKRGLHRYGRRWVGPAR